MKTGVLDSFFLEIYLFRKIKMIHQVFLQKYLIKGYCNLIDLKQNGNKNNISNLQSCAKYVGNLLHYTENLDLK